MLSLALEWDVGLKPRAVLTSLGTLEFNYVDGRHCYSGGVLTATATPDTTRTLVASGRICAIGNLPIEAELCLDVLPVSP